MPEEKNQELKEYQKRSYQEAKNISSGYQSDLGHSIIYYQ